MKRCSICSAEFQSISPSRMYCDSCKKSQRKIRQKKYKKNWYEKNKEKAISAAKERMARLKAEGKAKDVNRKYRKAQRARYLAAGLTTNGAPRKQPFRKRDGFCHEIKLQRVAYRKWHWEWLRVAAPNGCVAAWYRGTGKPWNNPRIDSAEKFKVRYHEDNEFRAREILKSQHRKKNRSAQITAQSDGTLTPKALGQLFAEARFCAYCMKEFGGYKDKTADHVEPLYLGGKHSIDNIVIACLSCNSSKGRKSLVQWLIAAQPT